MRDWKPLFTPPTESGVYEVALEGNAVAYEYYSVKDRVWRHGRLGLGVIQGWREFEVAKKAPAPAGIYVASKAHRYMMWQALREHGVPIISTWIDEGGIGQTEDWSDLYSRAVREASSCSVLICYSEAGDQLKGALVEVGAALSHGRPVLWVGPRQNCCAHPLVTECTSIESAIVFAKEKGFIHVP